MPSFEPYHVLWYALAFLLAAAITAYVTPLTIHVAHVFRITDTPDGRLKKHSNPTPYLGGLAVAAGFVVSFGLLSTNESMDERALGILAGGFMMLLVAPVRRMDVIRALSATQGQVYSCHFTETGTQGWKIY